MSIIICASILASGSIFSVTANARSWYNDGKYWYNFDDNGEMEIGWYYEGGDWYYFDAEGNMVTGWYYDGANW